MTIKSNDNLSSPPLISDTEYISEMHMCGFGKIPCRQHCTLRIVRLLHGYFCCGLFMAKTNRILCCCLFYYLHWHFVSLCVLLIKKEQFWYISSPIDWLYFLDYQNRTLESVDKLVFVIKVVKTIFVIICHAIYDYKVAYLYIFILLS